MAYSTKKSKPQYISEPYGLPFELTKKDEFENGLTIEPTYVPTGSGNNPYGGKMDLHYKIKEWGYVFPTKKDALKYAKTHVETNGGIIIEKKNPELRRRQ